MRKGIVLAGGQGTRLKPLTDAVSKQLLPLYDKPMVFYPISVLMLSGIRDILIISDPYSLPMYQRLLGDGSNYGLNFEYTVQTDPNGLPEAFILGEKFIDGESNALILGDNFFHGQGLSELLQEACHSKQNVLFVRPSIRASEFGVCKFNDNDEFVELVEKPADPPSDLVATGLYFFDNNAPEIAKSLKISARGELEIADMINVYAKQTGLSLKKLGRGCAWIDTGSFEGLYNASTYVRTLQDQQGFKIGCLEEIALKSDWITIDDLSRRLSHFKGDYRNYLENLIGTAGLS